jgi:CelD/BcsL family acetyltransferase involved in cellulose biosynthesis
MRDQTFLLDAPVDAVADDIAFKTRRPAAAPHSPFADIRLSIHLDLRAIEQRWRAFVETADGTVFQSFDWLSAWQQHVGSRTGVTPVVVIGTDAAGEMLFLLPLAIDRFGPVRRLTWLGSDLCDYNVPLLASNFSVRVGARRFAQIWRDILVRVESHPDLGLDFVHMEKMPDVVGAQRNPFMQLPRAKHASGAYQTRLTGDWDTFYAGKRSTATRRGDRRKRKKLSEIGEVRFVTATDADEIEQTLDTLILQKGRLFAHMGVTNIFARTGWSEFFRALAIDPATRHMVHVSRLEVGSTCAAANLGLIHRGCYSHVLASYHDGDVSKYGPGAAHLHDLMRYAIEHHCDMFDFTVGDEPYKRDWCDSELTLYNHISIASWRGAIMALPLIASRKLKRTVKRTPWLWNAVTKARALVGSLRGPKQPLGCVRPSRGG